MRGKLRRRAGRARLGDAVDGVATHNAQAGRYDAGHAGRGACSIARWPTCASSTCARRCADDGAGRGAEPRARGGARGSAWRRGEQAVDPAEPPRLRDRGVLPAVRRHLRVSRTAACRSLTGASRQARRRRGWRARCHYCNYLRASPDGVPAMRGAVPGARRLRHRAGRSGDRARSSRTRASRASTATPFASGAAWSTCSRGSRGARSTCSSARR